MEVDDGQRKECAVMRKQLLMMAIAAFALAVVAGCSCPLCGEKKAETKSAALCGGCGQVKGSEVCCAADAAKCAKCGLAKGSPGCCKITKGKDAALCTGCGQIKGSDACCKPGAEKCAKCDLAKGSPGCCKLQ